MRNLMIIACLVFIGSSVFDYSRHRSSQVNQVNFLTSQAIEQGIKFPEVFVEQAVHESNWFKSAVSIDHNNLFGIMCNSEPECICKKTNRGDKDGTYCHYEDRISSIRNYKKWQDKRFYEYKKAYGYLPTTKEEYYRFLKNLVVGGVRGRVYATDPRYIQKLKMRRVQLDNLTWFPLIS